MKGQQSKCDSVYRKLWLDVYRNIRIAYRDEGTFERPFWAAESLEGIVSASVSRVMFRLNCHFNPVLEVNWNHRTAAQQETYFFKYTRLRRCNLAEEIVRINEHRMEERYTGVMRSWQQELKYRYSRPDIPGGKPPAPSPEVANKYRRPITIVGITRNPQ